MSVAEGLKKYKHFTGTHQENWKVDGDLTECTFFLLILWFIRHLLEYAINLEFLKLCCISFLGIQFQINCWHNFRNVLEVFNKY